MNSARSASRLRLIVVLTLTAALALGSFWVLEVMKRATDQTPAPSSASQPDYYVANFNFVRLSETGEVRYQLSGKKLTHYPADDSHLIELPVLHSLSSKAPPMTGNARRAVVDNTGSKIHLYEDVEIDRPADANNEHFHLSSEYLLLLPDDDVMRTHLPALIASGSSTLEGNSMWANNASRELRLSGNVHATYQPPAMSNPR